MSSLHRLMMIEFYNRCTGIVLAWSVDVYPFYSSLLSAGIESGGMDYFALIMIAVGLAMDAFAVSIGNGISIRDVNLRHALAFGFMFGGMQMLMPIVGFFMGSSFSVYIENIDHWVAFALLAFIGGKMFFETFRAEKKAGASTGGEAPSLGKLFLLGIATSIDALVVGISIALTGWNIWISSLVIGIIAFAFSFVGILAGKRIGARFQKNAGRLGGLVLIGIGIKILFEHLLA